MRRLHLTFGLLLALGAQGSEFYTGQAARAVLGQSSFSAHDPGVAGTAMSVVNGKLYVADASGKLLTFDLSQIPGARDEMGGRGTGCPVCGFRPVASLPQRVAFGAGMIGTSGKTLAAIDLHARRVMLWRDMTVPGAALTPDVILQASESGLVEPISVALDGRRLFVGDAALHQVLVWNSFPTRNNQAPDAVLGSYLPDSALGADTISRPDALASDGLNLYVSDTLTRRILVFTPGDSQLHAEAVVNSASLLPGAFAGGTLISLAGSALSDQSLVAKEDGTTPLPTKLGGVEVVFNGVALPIVSVSPSEVRAQLIYLPADLSAGSLYIRTEHADNSLTITDPVPVSLAAASPGLFAFAGDEPRPAMAFSGTGPVSSDSPVAPGETIRLWATGLHVAEGSGVTAGTPFTQSGIAVSPVSALVDGDPAEVISVTMPRTSIGIYEVLVRIPLGLYSNGSALVTLLEDGVGSNTVVVPVAR